MRISTTWRWLALPWRPAGAAAALLGAFAAPALVVGSAAMFEAAAGDAIARRLVAAEDRGALGVMVSTKGRLAAMPVGELSDLVEQRLAAVGDPVRTLVTDRLDIEVVGAPSGEPQPGARRGGRLFSRPGAIESLDVLAGDPAEDGAWISQRVAERYGLLPGDSIRIGSPVELVVAGIYADVWVDPSPYWRDVPPDLAPRFVTAFNAPNFELVIVPDGLMTSVAPPGSVRWEAPVRTLPRSLSDLRRLDATARSIERAFTQDPELSAALDRMSGTSRPPPGFETRLDEVLARAEAAAAQLGPPLTVTRIGGIALGLAVTASGAVFAFRRRATEARLLAADGDGALRFAGRAAVQQVAPAIVGAIAGVAIGWTIVRLAGPTRSARLGDVVMWEVAAVTAVGVASAAAVCGFLGRRVLETASAGLGGLRASWLWLALGLAVAGWVQVGTAGRHGEFDAVVVAFPLVGMCAGVGLVLAGLRWVLRRARRSGASLPVPLYLAWRRLTAAEASSLLLAGAVGVAFGLTTFSVLFVDTLRAAGAAKATTVVGAESRVDVLGPFAPGDVPPDSTILRSQTTRATPGVSVVVVAIDPDSFASVVDWPGAFGGTADDVVDRLGERVDGSVPALRVEGRSLAASGGFGRSPVVPYRVVGTVGSVPLASDVYPTLVVRADVVDAVMVERFEAQRVAGDPPFESPLASYAQTVVSRGDVTVLDAWTTDSLLRTSGLQSRSEALGTVENQAIAWAFQYLRLLGGLAALASFGALALYLAERRSTRAVATVMAEQVGMRTSTSRWAAIYELVAVTMVAIASAGITSVVVARRLFPRFEPDPRLPPTVGLSVDAVLVASVVAVHLAVVAALAAAAHRPTRATTKAMVLRGRR